MGVFRAALPLLVAAAAAERDEANCTALGFAPALLCSSCDKLADVGISADDPLISECRGCCTEEVAGTGGTYANAVLDICK